MNANEAGGTCAACGAALPPGVPACAACGKLVEQAGARATATLATPRMSRTSEVVFGSIAGLAGGVVLTIVLFVASYQVVGIAQSKHVPEPLLLGIGIDLVVLVPLLAIGIRSAARGRVLLGTSLIVAGIVAAVPTVGCNLVIYSMRAIR
jgi:hypothetical protein